ncbi:MAG: hypothetical protein IJ986_09815, partial [Bacteroidales bacterium]|nr:hypothetical protein [Bacteroidales bacterium]
MDEIYSLFDSCAPTGTETKQRDNKLLSLREQQIDRMTAEMIKKPAPKKAKHKVEDPTNLFTAASASMQEASAPMMSDKKKEVENPVQNFEKEQVTAQEDDINKKKTYEKEEIFKEVTEYFGGDELAASVWIDKYALKNREGKLVEHTPADMHHRIASEFNRIERKYPNPMSEELIFSLLDHFKYIIPQGSPMAGIGNKYQVVSLSNCFVIGNGDNS